MKIRVLQVLTIGILLWASLATAQQTQGNRLPPAPVLPVLNLPDLKVTKIWLAQYAQNVTQYTPLVTNPIPGQQVYIVCEFENAGQDLKGTHRIVWLVDGIQVATSSFGDMPAGMKRNPAGRYTIAVSPGTHKFECVVDADNKISESNEQNNRLAATIQVGR
jgi:hypothetical protein